MVTYTTSFGLWPTTASFGLWPTTASRPSGACQAKLPGHLTYRMPGQLQKSAATSLSAAPAKGGRVRGAPCLGSSQTVTKLPGHLAYRMPGQLLGHLAHARPRLPGHPAVAGPPRLLEVVLKVCRSILPNAAAATLSRHCRGNQRSGPFALPSGTSFGLWPTTAS